MSAFIICCTCLNCLSSAFTSDVEVPLRVPQVQCELERHAVQRAIFHVQRELEAAGAAPTWRGHSDTEVLLHGYREWGAGFVAKLVGMFAFAIADRRGRPPFADFGRPVDADVAQRHSGDA